MPLHVQRQVIGAREAAFAHVTVERLGAGVFADVTREFVGAREPPHAAGEVAAVRLLACRTTNNSTRVKAEDY